MHHLGRSYNLQRFLHITSCVIPWTYMRAACCLLLSIAIMFEHHIVSHCTNLTPLCGANPAPEKGFITPFYCETLSTRFLLAIYSSRLIHLLVISFWWQLCTLDSVSDIPRSSQSLHFIQWLVDAPDFKPIVYRGQCAIRPLWVLALSLVPSYCRKVRDR